MFSQRLGLNTVMVLNMTQKQLGTERDKDFMSLALAGTALWQGICQGSFKDSLSESEVLKVIAKN